MKGEPTALVVGKDNKVEQRTLTVSRTVGNNWLVTSGLKPGDRLIVEGTAEGPSRRMSSIPCAADSS